jgi:hypothetical protein
MLGFSDNFISGARFDSDIYVSDYMENVREMLDKVKIVDTNFPKYANTYKGYEHVYAKYYDRMPYLFDNNNIATYYIPSDKELSRIWNYTIANYDSLYDYFDEFQHRFIECCPVELKCEVVSMIRDEYFVLDGFRVLFNHENTDLIQKTIFYCLIKYL